MEASALAQRKGLSHHAISAGLGMMRFHENRLDEAEEFFREARTLSKAAGGARKALSETPEAARFKWRATSEWIKGTHSRATVDGFSGLGGEQKHRQPYQFCTDHPEIFASEDNGAIPVEMMLVGLAGCLTAGIASVAQNRNIQLRSVRATLEAGMDLQGILGIDANVRNGFNGVKVHHEIDADATAEQIAALVAQ